MAEITPVMDFLEKGQSGRPTIVAFTWANMANGDTGKAVSMSAYADRSVQVTGTFGTGGAAAIKGSNNTVNFETLTNPQGNALSIGTAKIEAITEMTRQIRPEVTGDGTTLLNVVIVARGV